MYSREERGICDAKFQDRRDSPECRDAHGLWAAPLAMAQEQPRRGGILRVALAADPPSLAHAVVGIDALR